MNGLAALSLREAVRGLARQKSIFIVAVLTLTLGLSMCTAMLCVVYGVVLRPIAYDSGRRLVVAWAGYEGAATERESFSEQAVTEWRAAARSLDGLAGFRYAQFTLLQRGETTDLQGAMVSPEFFSVLGVRAGIGTAFDLESARATQGKIVMLSHKLWRQRFGSDPAVAGQQINLGGEIFSVTGVMPADFDVPSQNVALWTPLPIASGTTAAAKAKTLMVIARLGPSISLTQAEGEAAGIARQLARDYADTHRGMRIHLVSFFDELIKDSRPLLIVASVAALLVLLICCANVSNLLLMRAVVKRSELATRAALGAPVRHLLGVSLAESLLVATTSGIVASGLARWMIGVLVRWAPVELPRAAAIGQGLQIPMVAGGSMIVAALLVSVPSIGEVARLKRSASTTSGGRNTARRFAGRLIVALEIAVALTLVAGSGLMARTLTALRDANPGWKTDHLLAAQIFLPASSYREPHHVQQFFETFIEQLRATPGVVSVAASSALPAEPMGADVSLPIQVPGRFTAGQASIRLVTPGIFKTLGIPLLQGRDLDVSDAGPNVRRLVINRAFARKHLPDATSVVGRQVVIVFGAPQTYEIVGEVGDVRHYGMLREATPEFYVPFASRPVGGMGVVVRTDGDPLAFAPAFRKQLWTLDPALPVASTKAMTDMVRDTWNDRTFLTIIIVGFAVVVVVATIAGVFSLMTYSVSRQVREIAIHMAVGAQFGDVIRLVMREAARTVGVGVVLGLVGAWMFGRGLASLMYGVSASDPSVLLIGALVVVVVAGLGAYLPSRRATKVDPLIALRTE
jgi:predicted permease